MPKKFGVNSKAADARARVEEQKQEKRQREEQAKADSEWVDEDKSLAAKLARQKAKEERKQLELQRKRELREIEEAEAKANAKIALVRIAKKVRPEQPKVTRVQIQHTQEASAKVDQAKVLSADAPAFEPPPDVLLDADINPNHAVRDEIQKYEEIGAEVVTAETIDEAIESLESRQTERHPEKRMAKAWKDYVEERYEPLKAENPSLKRSQLMELLHEQWKKAPENPMNKDHSSYNYKSG